MKQFAKFLIIVLSVLFPLTACSDEPVFTLHFGNYLSPHSMDMLIPLSPDDENFCDDPEDTTEIARYDKDGFRSLVRHYRGVEYSCHEIGGHELEALDMQLVFPDIQTYYDICDTAGVCRIAIVGASGSDGGDIVKVTEDIPMKLSDSFYLDTDMDFDVRNMTLRPTYSNPVLEKIINISVVISFILSYLSVIAALLLIPRSSSENRDDLRNLTLIFALECIPAVIAEVLNIIGIAHGTPDSNDVISRIFSFSGNNGVILFSVAPLIIAAIISGIATITKRSDKHETAH